MATIDFQYPHLFSEVSDMNFLKGTVKSVDKDNDKMKVDIDGVGEIDAIEVFYHCENESDVTGGASAFKEDDRVLLINPKGRCVPDNWDPFKKLRVIGFEDGVLRLCVTTTTTTTITIATTTAPQSGITDWKSPNSCVAVPIGTHEWKNPQNAKVRDGNWAYTPYPMGGPVDSTPTDWLRCTDFGFTTSDIPEGATIDGIHVQLDNIYAMGWDMYAQWNYLRTSEGQVGDPKSGGALDPMGTHDTVDIGHITQDWNAGLSDGNVKSSGFGVDVQFMDGGPDPFAIFVDHVRIRIAWSL